MANTLVTCETVKLTVQDESLAISSFTIPAYTVEQPELAGRVKMLLARYLRASRKNSDPVSLGDFALYVIAEASGDPREQ